jgi:hypothetical protein
MTIPRYGMRFSSIRYYQNEGITLRNMTGFPFSWSYSLGRTLTTAEATRSWASQVERATDPRTIGHAAIMWAAALSTENRARVLSGVID